jgi:hypothetical protein
MLINEVRDMAGIKKVDGRVIQRNMLSGDGSEQEIYKDKVRKAFKEFDEIFKRLSNGVIISKDARIGLERVKRIVSQNIDNIKEIV